jgi:hypothetical protein
MIFFYAIEPLEKKVLIPTGGSALLFSPQEAELGACRT